MGALGPSVLSPLLFDIYSNIQRIHEVYGNKIYLENLDSNVTPPDGSAKKGAIYTYFSTMANLLFKWNYLKYSIQEQRRNQFMIATTLFTILITAITVGYGAFAYFFVRRIIDTKQTANRIDLIYNMIMISTACMYTLFFMVIVYQKAKKAAQSHYDVDHIYADEPGIQHVLSMLQIEDWSIFNRHESNKKEYKVKGTNPVLGFFLHHQQNVNIKYTFHPSPMHKGKTNEGGLAGKKVFRFINEDKNPYTLTTDSLLSPANTPYHLFGASDGKAYVDPFIPEQSLIGPVEIFHQRIEKYDPKSQVKLFNSSLFYLQSLMSPNGSLESQITQQLYNKETRQKLVDYIVDLFSSHQLLALFDVKPSSAYLEYMSQNKKRNVLESVTREDFLKNTMSRDFVALFYHDRDKNGYVFEEQDFKVAPFILSGSFYDDSFTLFKRHEKDEPINIQIASIQEDKLFVRQNFTPTFREEESTVSMRRPYIFTAEMDTKTGMIMREDTESTRVLGKKNNSPPMPNRLLIETHDSIDENMTVYSLDFLTFIQIQAPTKWEATFSLLKPYFLDMSAQHIHRTVDTSRKITIKDLDPEGLIIKQAETQLGDAFSMVEDSLLEFIQDIPEKYNSVYADAPEHDENNTIYISPQDFTLRISHMSQHHFLHVFLRHLDTIRRTSTGIERLHQMYDINFYARQKNIMLFEVTTITVAIAGALIVVKTIAYNYLDFMCANIEFDDRKKQLNNEKYDIDELIQQLESSSGQVDDQLQQKRQMIERKHIELNSEKTRLMAWYILVSSTYAVIYMITVGLLHAWKERYKMDLFESNMEKNKNTSVIITHADYLFRKFTQRVKDGRFIRLTKTFDDPGDVNELFFYLKEHAFMEKPNDVIDLKEDVDFSEEYKYFKSMLDAYGNPNTLVSYASKTNPFPVLDTFAYIGILFGVGVLIFVSNNKFQPFKHLQNIFLWMRIRGLWRKGIAIDPASYQFNCFEQSFEKDNINSWFMMISAFVMIVIAVLFLIMLQKYIYQQRI